MQLNFWMNFAQEKWFNVGNLTVKTLYNMNSTNYVSIASFVANTLYKQH